METLNLLEKLAIKEEREVRSILPIELKMSFFLQNKPINNNDYIDLKNLEKVTTILEVGNIKIFTQMTRSFIHQLGQRVLEKYYNSEYLGNDVFNNANEIYNAVRKDWHFHFNDDRKKMTNYCIKTMTDTNEKLIIKYYEVDNKFILYGIVSDNYKNMNQTVFRNTLMNVIKTKYASFNLEPYQMRQSNKSYFAPIQENFRFNLKHDFHFDIDITVSYGLNNGYKSYSLYMRRYTSKEITDRNNIKQLQKVLYTSVSIEDINKALKAGLTTHIANNIKELLQQNNYRLEEKEITSILNQGAELGLNWRNNPRYHENSNPEDDMKKFLENVFIKILAYCFDFDKKLQLSKSKYYSASQIDKFFQLMRIAQSSERRVYDKIQEFQKIHGNTYYNISEAFREVGTFETAIARPVQRFLIEVGTKFIEEESYLEKCINNNQEILMTGDYSFVDN